MFSYEEIKELAELVGKNRLGSIEVKSANGDYIIIKGQQPSVCAAQEPETNPVPAVPSENIPAVPAAEEKKDAAEEKVISSPIVGTFYSAADPESAPFVKVGDKIEKGDVICIIEAMKIMNEVNADMSGTVKQILASDGDAVEFGQPLMILE